MTSLDKVIKSLISFVSKSPFLQNILRVEGLSIPDQRPSMEDDGIIIEVNIHGRHLAELKSVVPAMNLDGFS